MSGNYRRSTNNTLHPSPAAKTTNYDNLGLFFEGGGYTDILKWT